MEDIETEIEWLEQHVEKLQDLVEAEWGCSADPTDYDAERERACRIFVQLRAAIETSEPTA